MAATRLQMAYTMGGLGLKKDEALAAKFGELSRRTVSMSMKGTLEKL
jgi:hypothetical protein